MSVRVINKEIILWSLISLVLLGALTVYATMDDSSFITSIFYDGNVIINGVHANYSAGDVLRAELNVQNREPFPIADAYIVIYLVQGCSTPVYPTQDSDCDTIFFEKKTGGISLAAGESKKVLFEYELPADLKPGTYRMDVYFKTPKTPIVGVVESFARAEYKSFLVSANGHRPGVKFVYSKTNIGGALSQRGPATLPGTRIPGAIYLNNTLGTPFTGKLDLKVCAFDDTSCEKYEVEQEYPVALDPYEIAPVIVSFNAPSEPNAYAIRLELRDESKKLESLYRSRIVVSGDTAKIKKLAANYSRYSKGDGGMIQVMVSGPYFPGEGIAKNAVLSVKLTDVSTGKTVFESERKLRDLSPDQRVVENFTFSAKESTNGLGVCARIISESRKDLDKYCYQFAPQLEAPAGNEPGGQEGNEKLWPSLFANKLALILALAVVLAAVIFIALKKGVKKEKQGDEPDVP